jgi:hypothetical protein
MADTNIILKFQKAMAAIQKQLDFQSNYRVFLDKLLSAYSRDPEIFEQSYRALIPKLFRPEWANFDTDFKNEYNNVVDVVNDLYKDLGADVNRDFMTIKNIERVNATRMGNFEQRAIELIQRKVRDGLFQNYSVEELERSLIGSGVEPYANTIARTQIKGYGRESKYTKANIGQVFYYEYVGQLRITTRPFCRDMLGKTLHIDEINELDNSFVSKTGKVYQQLQPVITYGGGWNCIHDWEPDPFYKPPKQKVRNKFIPARTIKDAEDWAVQNEIARKVNYKGLTLELANKTNQQIFKRKREYDIIFDRIRISDIKKTDALMTTETEFVPNKITSNTLIINKNRLKSIGDNSLGSDDINKGIKKLFNIKWWTVENYEQAIDHELGHYLTNLDAHKLGKNFNAPEMEFFISKVSQINGFETLAEMFNYYLKNGKSNFTTEMLEFFNKFMRIQI